MKNLLFLSISMLCLAITALIGFHIGSRNAVAQSKQVIAYQVVRTDFDQKGAVRHYIITASGDVYSRQGATEASMGWQMAEPQYLGNFFTRSQ